MVFLKLDLFLKDNSYEKGLPVPFPRLPPPRDQQALAVWNGGWRSGGGWGDRGIVLLTASPCRRLASNFVFIVAAAADT